MNVLWSIFILISLVIMLFCSPEGILPALLSGVETGIKLCFGLLAIYVLWSGIIAILEKCGLSQKIARFLSPITRKLFPNESEEARRLASLNFSANLLGAGGAATPLGIKTIQSFRKSGDKITFSMVLFTVINTTSIQLIPTTILSLRSAAGSLSPYDIILPTVLVSVFTTFLGVFLVFCTKKSTK